MNIRLDQGNKNGDSRYFDGRYTQYSRGLYDNCEHETKTNQRFSNLNYPHEGSSSYQLDSSHGLGEHNRILYGSSGLDRVQKLELDREGLLRKLDELKTQLGTCDDVRGKQRGIGHRMDGHLYGHTSYVPEGPLNSYRANLQPLAPDQDVLDPYNCNDKLGRALSDHSSIYPQRFVQNDFPGYRDSYLQNEVLRSGYQHPCHDQFIGPQIGYNHGNFASHVGSVSLNGPQCSCSQCCRKWQIQAGAQHPTDRSIYMSPSNPIQHRHLSSKTYASGGYSIASSGDLDFKSGRFNHGFMRKTMNAHGNKQVCHPKAGGAPFMACPKCFVLLKLPKKLIMTPKIPQTIRCGACSRLVLVQVENQGIVITVPKEQEQISTKGGVGSGKSLEEVLQTLDDFLDAKSVNSGSNGNDVSAFNLILENVEPNVLSRDHSVKSGQSDEGQVPISSSSSYSEDEPSPDSVIVMRENTISPDLASKDDTHSQLLNSPHEMEPDDDLADFVFSRCGMRNKSRRTSRQNSVKDVLKEKVIIYNESVNSDVAVSEEVNKEEKQPKTNVESESVFAGFFRKNFKDLLRPGQREEIGRSNVVVNGRPLSNRLVKKAEKFAGPIQPGNYWYDYRAGFWGVMGQPCHGIIPPFIEEFNHPMPKSCGAGNTGVFVNGRELHEVDLELLAGRGLPTTRDKFYMIEISGRVVDEYTGEELDDLGKLAPTIEKVKHGFGMRPRALAE